MLAIAIFVELDLRMQTIARHHLVQPALVMV